MRAVVVYESMYGNTHLVADAIGEGLGALGEVTVVSAHRADRELLAAADVVVVGGPTHAHGMTHASTRRAAADAAGKPDSDLDLDPDAEGPGLREWFADIGQVDGSAAAFDTRMPGPPALTGRASKGIARKLRQHGATLVAEPESFLVTKDNHIEAEEGQRAVAWGEKLAAAVAKITAQAE